MKEKLEKRLQALRDEYEAGQNMLVDLQAREANLRETLLRISGAIQVLEEMLRGESSPAAEGLEHLENLVEEKD